MTMQVKPFAFDRVFSVAPHEEALDADKLRLENAHLEGEIARLRQRIETESARAHAEGFQAGMEQVRGERQAALLAATDAIHAAIEALDEHFAAVERRVVREGAEFALAAADHLAARALAADPAGAIDDAIGRALAQVRRGQPIRIRVHPDLVADIEARIAERQSRDRRRLTLTVIGDAALAPGDAHIAWDQGGLTLDRAARLEAIAREIDALLPR